MHQAVNRGAVARQPDQGAPERQPGDEGAGSVDRVEDPNVLGVGTFGAELLAVDAVCRKGLLDELPHHGFAGTVGLGHGIEGAAARLVFRSKGRAEKGQDGLAGRGGELIHEIREIDDGHGKPCTASALRRRRCAV
jgi:hypothetical protein